jgi:hypothetical protein
MPALAATRRCCSSKIKMYITGSLDTRVAYRSSNRYTHDSWLVTRSRRSDTLADLVQHGNEWKEMHYITRDSTMLGFKNESIFMADPYWRRPPTPKYIELDHCEHSYDGCFEEEEAFELDAYDGVHEYVRDDVVSF